MAHRETLQSLSARHALAGRTAIVTGASGAFGSATLSVLRYLGADAVGLDRIPGDRVLACDVGDDRQGTAGGGGGSGGGAAPRRGCPFAPPPPAAAAAPPWTWGARRTPRCTRPWR